MTTLLFSLAVFLLALAGLALDPLFRREGLKGSCGGAECRNACHACPRKKGHDDV